MYYLLQCVLTGIILSPVIVFLCFIQSIFSVFAPKKNRILSNINLALISRWVCFLLQVRVRVYGLENIPENRGCVFMSNHQSFFDILLIYGYLRKPLAMIAKQSLRYLPIIGVWMQHLGCYLINRKDPSQVRAIFQKAAQTINEEGYSTLIYPEGTRSLHKQMGPLRMGSMKLPLLGQCPVVPITISGSWKLSPKYSKKRDKLVDIVIHPPIWVNQNNGPYQQKLLVQIEDSIKRGFTTQND